MTSWISRAPSSGELKIFKNAFWIDVCGEVYCNRLKIGAYDDIWARNMCVQFEADSVNTGHVTSLQSWILFCAISSEPYFWLSWNSRRIKTSKQWSLREYDVMMTSSCDLLLIFEYPFSPIHFVHRFQWVVWSLKAGHLWGCFIELFCCFEFFTYLFTHAQDVYVIFNAWVFKKPIFPKSPFR